jgi:hypothetical protein
MKMKIGSAMTLLALAVVMIGCGKGDDTAAASPTATAPKEAPKGAQMGGMKAMAGPGAANADKFAGSKAK